MKGILEFALCVSAGAGFTLTLFTIWPNLFM